ncbi:MAG: SurA N-terminal domain-containing protein [Candidatus Paceibacterota bacterium]|jgi:hypothetical protein
MPEETTENQQGTTKKRSGLSFSKLLVFIVILAVIVAGIYLVIKQGINVVGSGGAVAIVNGEKISQSVYDNRYAQLAASITTQGQSATTTEMQTTIKNRVLDDLITETMLLQAADKAGIKANAEEVDTAFTQSKSQFTDETEFETVLTEQGYTDKTFKEFLTRDNIIRQYLTANIDTSSATATETEIKTLYDQAAANNETIPPLSEVKTQVENQIIQLKQQQLVTNFVQQLKASSTIETLLK